MDWRDVLVRVLVQVAETLDAEGIEWAVVGSTATALQGCRVTPHDIEFLLREPERVPRFAELMALYVAAACDVPSPEGGPFRSTLACPLFIGSYLGLDWHYAAWDVDGITVEATHVVPPGGHPAFRGSKPGESDGMWDCSPRIWPHIRRVTAFGREIPVVPLECQVSTNLVRGAYPGGERFQQRAIEICRVLRQRGYDQALLSASLKRQHAAWVQEALGSKGEFVIRDS